MTPGVFAAALVFQSLVSVGLWEWIRKGEPREE